MKATQLFACIQEYKSLIAFANDTIAQIRMGCIQTNELNACEANLQKLISHWEDRLSDLYLELCVQNEAAVIHLHQRSVASTDLTPGAQV